MFENEMNKIFEEESILAQCIIDGFAKSALIGIVSRGEITNVHEMARKSYEIAHAMWAVRNSNEVYE